MSAATAVRMVLITRVFGSLLARLLSRVSTVISRRRAGLHGCLVNARRVGPALLYGAALGQGHLHVRGLRDIQGKPCL